MAHTCIQKPSSIPASKLFATKIGRNCHFFGNFRVYLASIRFAWKSCRRQRTAKTATRPQDWPRRCLLLSYSIHSQVGASQPWLSAGKRYLGSLGWTFAGMLRSQATQLEGWVWSESFDFCTCRWSLAFGWQDCFRHCAEDCRFWVSKIVWTNGRQGVGGYSLDTKNSGLPVRYYLTILAEMIDWSGLWMVPVNESPELWPSVAKQRGKLSGTLTSEPNFLLFLS